MSVIYWQYFIVSDRLAFIFRPKSPPSPSPVQPLQPQPHATPSDNAAGLPIKYRVVVCGASGHNIRNQPTFKATPVGMLVQGNVVSAVDRVTNGEGVWIKLSEESAVAHCGLSCATAWSLAADTSHVVYLKQENDYSKTLIIELLLLLLSGPI